MDISDEQTNSNKYSICRVCMQSDDKNLFPIFNEILSGENTITVADIITECTKYPVAKNDLLPILICNICVETARKAHQFKRRTEEAYRRLKALYDTTWVPKEEKDICYGGDLSGVGVINIDKYTQTDRSSEFKCTSSQNFLGNNEFKKNCAQSSDENGDDDNDFNSGTVIRVRSFARHLSKEKRCEYKCNICLKQFNRRNNLSRHLLHVHMISAKKSNSQICKEYRERQKLSKPSKINLRTETKSNAQKCKEYRERQKMKEDACSRSEKNSQKCKEYREKLRIIKDLENPKNKATLEEPEIENQEDDDDENEQCANPFASDEEDYSIKDEDVRQFIETITHPEILLKDEDPDCNLNEEKENPNKLSNIPNEKIHSKVNDLKSEKLNENNVFAKNHKDLQEENKTTRTFEDNLSDNLNRAQSDEDVDRGDNNEPNSVDRRNNSEREILFFVSNVQNENTSGIKLPKRRYNLAKTKDNRCQECNRTFTRYTHLLRHMVIHTNERPHVCNLCEKGFSRPDHLQKHIQSLHGEKIHKCDQCSNAYGNKDSLLRHIESKHNRDPSNKNQQFDCDMCNKKFTTKVYFDKHKLFHSDRLYACKHCSETFPEKELMKKHEKEKHAQPRNFLCNMCGEAFVRSEELKIHIRRHTGEKPYKCSFCDKGFPRNSDLRRHERYHIGHKPDLCNLCGKSFHRPYNLAKHMRTHTGEKPYKCNQCPKAYAQKTDLKAHIRRHTGERFRCEMCNASFLRRNGLNNHLKKVHDIKVTSFTGRLPKIEQPVKEVADQHPVLLPSDSSVTSLQQVTTIVPSSTTTTQQTV